MGIVQLDSDWLCGTALPEETRNDDEDDDDDDDDDAPTSFPGFSPTRPLEAGREPWERGWMMP